MYTTLIHISLGPGSVLEVFRSVPASLLCGMMLTSSWTVTSVETFAGDAVRVRINTPPHKKDFLMQFRQESLKEGAQLLNTAENLSF